MKYEGTRDITNHGGGSADISGLWIEGWQGERPTIEGCGPFRVQ